MFLCWKKLKFTQNSVQNAVNHVSEELNTFVQQLNLDV